MHTVLWGKYVYLHTLKNFLKRRQDSISKVVVTGLSLPYPLSCSPEGNIFIFLYNSVYIFLIIISISLDSTVSL